MARCPACRGQDAYLEQTEPPAGETLAYQPAIYWTCPDCGWDGEPMTGMTLVARVVPRASQVKRG